ncbi:MAG: hypothetical protein NTV34_15605 [Proteobacteria bacterium]|nr:hypothetical protein [Pseudomonadota bacterium]
MNILNLITALLALSLYTGCHLKSADVSVRVLVKTPEGEPVTNADIYIDKQKVGDTNAYGTFTGTFNAKQATVHRIEIRKHNDAYYYAPHLETVTIPKQNRFTWNVTATMYLAPKQKLKSIVNVPPTDDLKTTDQVQPETVAPISLLDATPFILSGSAKVLQLDDGIVGVPSKISFKESTDSLFTIHTFAARSPLEDVEVMACIPGRELQPLCRSNTRGRCTANMSDLSEIDQAALVVRHSGFETATIQGP